ncbi:hypothetical protein DID88_003710 [Monilinia fructigena]|uniref:Uncharacterized protein n=1 Tax=Monilinia fructigena TaxID=38457 RepID=A0A395ITM4_9HELO|nr:hypothetical protein DID88_003710 [Monilinia fructigena]
MEKIKIIPNTPIFHELAMRFVGRQSVFPSGRSYDNELKHIKSSHDAGTLAGIVALRDDPGETYQLQRKKVATADKASTAEIEDCISRLLSKAEAENALVGGKGKGKGQGKGPAPPVGFFQRNNYGESFR